MVRFLNLKINNLTTVSQKTILNELDKNERKITIDDLRKIERYKNLSVDESEKIIESIYNLTLLTYYIIYKT